MVDSAFYRPRNGKVSIGFLAEYYELAIVDVQCRRQQPLIVTLR